MQKPVDFPVSLIKDNSFAGSKHIQEMLMKNMSAVTRNHIRNQRIFSLVRQFLHGSDQFPSIVLHNVIQHSQCLPQGDSLSDEMIEDTIHAAWKLEMLGHLTARQVVERVMAPLVVDLKGADLTTYQFKNQVRN